MQKQNDQKKENKFFISRLIMCIFFMALMCTMFMPIISFDKYVEYTFKDSKYYQTYESYQTPIATNLKPISFITAFIFNQDLDQNIVNNYEKLQRQLNNDYQRGKINKKEYELLLSQAKQTNDYYVNTICSGVETYNRLQSHFQLIGILLTVFYALIAVMLLLSIANVIFNTKTLYIVNAQSSWIVALFMLLLIIYVFSTSMTNTQQLELVNDEYLVTETTMICLSAKFNFILIFLACTLYSIFSIIVSNKFIFFANKKNEVPEFISSQLRQEIKKKQSSINSAEFKNNQYKHKSKKHKK